MKANVKGLAEERLRVTKAGFTFKNDQIMFISPGNPNCPGEILNGCPVSRCIGDQRFKCTPGLDIEKQPITCMPAVSYFDCWKEKDFLIIGSSGFWEMFRYNIKNTIEKIIALYTRKQTKAMKEMPPD